MADQRSDEEVIRALTQRGVDPGQAALLVADLRSGRKVTVQSPLPPELNLRRRSRSARTSSETTQPEPAPVPAAKPRSEPAESQPQAGGSKSPFLARVLIIPAILVLMVVAFILYQRYQDDAFPPLEPAATTPKTGEISPVAPPETAPASRSDLAAPLVLELQAGGLRIGSNLVTRTNLLSVLHDLLGVPNRTNQVAQTGATIYAYDSRGLLVYSLPGAGTNSLVLDCEATGGLNGTTSPFVGAFKLGDRVIRADMALPELTAIKELGLKESGGSSTVWNGRCHGMDLVFAYLKSPRHLSLIEIDLE
ncbi:MAG TPA: hypothetical protein P5205_06180 [Candidatus Paceibacterota bacterium]|nr:hypothetical protein [Verrucomicrobiota bacterium]HSA09942.1 hypothetical protein [Candidatus Paceibacterota bacterium]